MKTSNNFYTRNLFILFFTFSLLGCDGDEFLNVAPTGFTLLSTVEDYENFLKNNNLDVGPQATIPMSDDLYFPDYNDVVSYLTQNISRIYMLNAYRWEDQIYEGDASPSAWRDPYNDIYYSNTIIHNIDDAELATKTEEDRARVKGWGYFRRAFANFILVNQFAKHYNTQSSQTDLGIPIVTSLDPVQGSVPRSTVKEVYDFIEADLLTALNLLPDIPQDFPKFNYRPSKVSTYATLARVYLYMGEWEKSRDAAQNAMNIINANVTVGLITIETHNGVANLWPAPNHLNKEVLWAKNAVAAGISPTQDNVFISPELQGLMDLNDTRFNIYLQAARVDNGIEGYTPNHKFSNFGWPTRNFAPNVPDVILMLAETNARLDNLPAAEEYLKMLREERITDYIHQDSADKASLINEIFNERWIEHMYSGLRWYDLKRRNVLGENISIEHPVIDGDGNVTEVLTLTPDSNRWVLQIPNTIIKNFQPGLIQND